MGDFFYGLSGLMFLLLAKVKHSVSGYTSPKPFDTSQADRCAEYDIQVVSNWLRNLGDYLGENPSVAGKNVLEIGPGSDLGIGLYLLGLGARSYNAIDVNPLAFDAPDAVYEAVLTRLGLRRDVCDALQAEVAATRAGNPVRLNYVVREDFDLHAAFPNGDIDVVFSQAAFEHLDDAAATVESLTAVCRAGAVAVVQIDLSTHSRWIRDRDPNNIYRYPSWLYRMFWFRGIPSRLRPKDYIAAFVASGWSDVRAEVSATIKPGYRPRLATEFRDADAQMSALSVYVFARLPADLKGCAAR